MPPVGGARRLAAGAQHTLIKTINQLPVINGLVVLLLAWFLGSLSLEVGVDCLVLIVEVREVHNQVLHHEHEHERGDSRLLSVVPGDGADAG